MTASLLVDPPQVDFTINEGQHPHTIMLGFPAEILPIAQQAATYIEESFYRVGAADVVLIPPDNHAPQADRIRVRLRCGLITYGLIEAIAVHLRDQLGASEVRLVGHISKRWWRREHRVDMLIRDPTGLPDSVPLPAGFHSYP